MPEDKLIKDIFLEVLNKVEPLTADAVARIINNQYKDVSITPSSAFITLKQMEKEGLVKQVPMTFNRVGWVKSMQEKKEAAIRHKEPIEHKKLKKEPVKKENIDLKSQLRKDKIRREQLRKGKEQQDT